jgi:hypothetical protein
VRGFSDRSAVAETLDTHLAEAVILAAADAWLEAAEMLEGTQDEPPEKIRDKLRLLPTAESRSMPLSTVIFPGSASRRACIYGRRSQRHTLASAGTGEDRRLLDLQQCAVLVDT